LVATICTVGETIVAEPLANVNREAVPDENRVELCILEARVEEKDEEDKVDKTEDKTLVLVPCKGIAILSKVVTRTALVAKDLIFLPVIFNASATSEMSEMLT